MSSRYYFHSGLVGEDLHNAKIPYYEPSDPMPTPQWAGELIARGDYLYFAQLAGSPPALVWRQVQSPGGTLPSNVVTYQISSTPPSPTTGSGKIYVNSSLGEVYFLANNQWIKIGPKGTEGEGFNAEPTILGSGACSGGLYNAVLLSNWQTGVNYGFLINGSASTYGGDYIEIWARNSSGASPVDSVASDNNGKFIVKPSDFAGSYPYLQIVMVTFGELVFPPDGPPYNEPSTYQNMCFGYSHETRIFNIQGVFNP